MSPKESTNRTIVVLAFGIAAIAVILFATVREVATTLQPAQPAAQAVDPIFTRIADRHEFSAWLSQWRTVEPYVSQTEFAAAGAAPLGRAAATVTTPKSEDLQPPVTNRYVYSPDRSMYADYLGSFGEPDQTLTLFGREHDGTLEQLALCGTPCGFDGLFWLDDARLVVFGREEVIKDDGTASCLPDVMAKAGSNDNCYKRLTVTLYDLIAGQKKTWKSDGHLFKSNPFGDAAMRRWTSGLTVEQKVEAGVAAEADLLTVHGTVIDAVGAAAGVFAIRSDKGQVTYVALVPKSRLTGPGAKPVLPADLHPGDVLDIKGLFSGDDTIVPVNILVTPAPALSLTAPVLGAETGAKLAVAGTARDAAGMVRLRLSSVRTGKTIVAATAKVGPSPDGGRGTFATTVRIPTTGLKDGDVLTLEATLIEPDGAATGTITLIITYRR